MMLSLYVISSFTNQNTVCASLFSLPIDSLLWSVDSFVWSVDSFVWSKTFSSLSSLVVNLLVDLQRPLTIAVAVAAAVAVDRLPVLIHWSFLVVRYPKLRYARVMLPRCALPKNTERLHDALSSEIRDAHVTLSLSVISLFANQKYGKLEGHLSCASLFSLSVDSLLWSVDSFIWS